MVHSHMSYFDSNMILIPRGEVLPDILYQLKQLTLKDQLSQQN